MVSLITALHVARDRLLIAIARLEDGDADAAVREIENAADVLRGAVKAQSNGASA